jgi:putative oxidoreductase
MFTPECAEKARKYAPLAIRLVLGIVFFAHGGQKLFGWFGGGGFAETAKMFEEGLKMSPGWLSAAFGGGGEFFGGLLVFLGLFTRFGAFLIACTMVVAIVAVHWSGGLFASNNGFEYPLVILGSAISLIMSGGGALALDNYITLPCCPFKGKDGDTPAA